MECGRIIVLGRSCLKDIRSVPRGSSCPPIRVKKYKYLGFSHFIPSTSASFEHLKCILEVTLYLCTFCTCVGLMFGTPQQVVDRK